MLRMLIAPTSPLLVRYQASIKAKKITWQDNFCPLRGCSGYQVHFLYRMISDV